MDGVKPLDKIYREKLFSFSDKKSDGKIPWLEKKKRKNQNKNI